MIGPRWMGVFVAETRIAGIGEVLMDVFEDGVETVGGAPVNVAFQAHQLLQANGRGRGEVVSAVGDDARGELILATLREAGLGTEFVAVETGRVTGIARVFAGGGEAGFEIAPDAAWDRLRMDAARDALADGCSAVAFGSLGQRSAMSGEAIRRFVGRVRGPRLYDVNLRCNTTDGVEGYSAEILEESCKVATMVKVNAGELVEVARMLGFPAREDEGEAWLWGQMEYMLGHYGLGAVVCTRGPLGAMVASGKERVKLADSTLKADEVHPVGAGDAFSAGMLYGVTQGCSVAVSARLADRLASWVTGYAAATPRLTGPILEELRTIEAGG